METADEHARRRRLSSRDIGTIVAIAVGIVTVTTALTSLLFQLLPGLKPPEPPNEISGRIENVRIELNVPLRDYFARVGEAGQIQQYNVADRNRRGVLVYVSYLLTGARAEKPKILAWWYYARGPRLPAGSQDGTQTIKLEPAAELTRAVAVQWLQLPPKTGFQRYRIREELYYKDQLVDIADSTDMRCLLNSRLASQQCHTLSSTR